MKTYIPKKPCKRGHWLRYTKGNGCVECNRTYAKKWNKANEEKHLESHKKYMDKNKDKRSKWSMEWAKRNKEVISRSYKRYAAKPVNKAKRLGVWNIRYAHRRLGDKWNDVLTWIYLNTPDGYVCDHIEPIDGVDRSGLHTPWNLQYLPDIENKKKRNKTDYLCESAISIDWEQYIDKPLPE